MAGKKNQGLSEKQIQGQILAVLNAVPGALVFKFYAGGLKFDDRWIPQNKAGVSDIIGCFRGKFIAIEVKRPGGRVSQLQANFIQNIRDRGGIAFVAYSIDDMVENLKIGGLV